MALSSAPSNAGFPPELLNAVKDQAERDADAVGFFLAALGHDPRTGAPSKPPLRLPGWFLLELGAVLRLNFWEQSALSVHRDAGLPLAHEALQDVLDRLKFFLRNPEAGQNTPLTVEVTRLLADRFAWSARRDLDADLLLGDVDEDGLVDVLASLLWKNRHLVHRVCKGGEGKP